MSFNNYKGFSSFYELFMNTDIVFMLNYFITVYRSMILLFLSSVIDL